MTDLNKLRATFDRSQIGILVKGTKEQTNCQPNQKVNCAVCGGWHHPKMIHIDYVGHAAVTNRLLDVDLNWTWEPLAWDDGLPKFDEEGGLWIKLTVGGVTRFGYGNAAPSQFKSVGDRTKECIGDAIRNAAMRFGVALELWHKGELNKEEEHKTEEDHKTEAEKKLPILLDEDFVGLSIKHDFKNKIISGQKTCDDVLTFLRRKHMLTTEQVETITSWGEKND